jgi:hypothetical protein
MLSLTPGFTTMAFISAVPAHLKSLRRYEGATA